MKHLICINKKMFIVTVTVLVFCTIILLLLTMPNEKEYNYDYDELHERHYVSSYEEYKEYITSEYSTKKVLALSFDDGPSEYTSRLVELLNEYEAKATFFVLGQNVAKHTASMLFAYECGNEIGIHSMNHKIYPNLNENMIELDIKECLELVEETLNDYIALIRVPYGITNNKVNEIVTNYGLKNITWDVDSLDWKLRNKDKVSSRVLKSLKSGQIILMHDIYISSIEAVKVILEKLSDEYEFITISELLILKESGHI